MLEKFQDLVGKIIITKSGNRYTLTETAGSGAQGIVYKESQGKYMVKFYYPSSIRQIDNDILEKLVFIQKVQKPGNFVAIRDLIDTPYIGYVMDMVVEHKPLNTYLIPNKNENFADWYNSGYGLRERLYIGYVIAKAFHALSEDNLSYCDISGNNILVKFSNTAVSVRMIDIDNIYVAGRGQSSVLGTPRYIAPEVVNKTHNPDIFTDNYSLAVILFELLRVGHPYVSDEIEDGTPEDEEAAYAGKTGYVTDQNSKNMLPAYVAFTDTLKNLFKKCFINGKKNRMERPSAQQFELALLDAVNKVIKCPSCGSWHYPRRENDKYTCPWCDSESKPLAFLTFYDELFEVNSDITEALKEGKEKPVSSYILREGKNYIHSSYILRSVNSNNLNWGGRNDKYLTIAKDADGYHAYNEFSKAKIFVKKYVSGEMVLVEPHKDQPLISGDKIFFDSPDNKDAIKNNDKQFKLIRSALFAEVNQ
ncbi:protein kinase [Treponema primitia]|uniref:protein kinase domain-containing protein n=1 Tax=Treponema primitia TaxID=88058 RepID=UPI0039815A3C